MARQKKRVPASGTTGQNFGWGLRWGTLAGVVYGGLLVVALVLGGTDAFAKKGISPFAAIAINLLGFPLTGAVVGLLRPWATHAIGSIFVGMIAVLPIAFGYALVFGSTSGQLDVWYVLIFAVLYGGVGGAIVRGVLKN